MRIGTQDLAAAIFKLWVLMSLLAPLTAKAQSNSFRHDSLWFTISTADHGTTLLASKNGYMVCGKNGVLIPYVRVPGLSRNYAGSHFLHNDAEGLTLKTVGEMGGAFWELRGDQLRQTDRNQITRMHINARYFKYRDTIFSHGGYGFWSGRRHVIFFNAATGVWDAVTPSGNSDLPPGIFNHMVWPAGDTIYVYAGNTVDALDPVLHHLQEDLWMYCIRTRTWKNLGKINPNLRFNNGGQLSFSYDKKQFVYPVNKKVALIDYASKKIKFYWPSGQLVELIRLRHPFADHYNRSDTLFWWKITDSKTVLNLPHRTVLSFVPISELLNREIGTEALLVSRFTAWWWLLVPASLLSVGFVLRKKVRRKELITLKPDGFEYRGKHHPAKPESMTLVKMLLEASGPVENASVMNIVSLPNLHLSHNTRVKNQLVENTNIQLKTILGISDDVILCNRLDSDKRVRMYEIRKDVFEV